MKKLASHNTSKEIHSMQHSTNTPANATGASAESLKGTLTQHEPGGRSDEAIMNEKNMEEILARRFLQRLLRGTQDPRASLSMN